MKNEKLTIGKKELVRELGYIPFKGLEHITAEEFAKNKAHPIYSRFTDYFVQRLNLYENVELTPEQYVDKFLEVMKNLLEEKGKHELTPGRLYRIYNYFDVLTDSVCPRAINEKYGKEYGKAFVEEAKREFSEKPSFLDLYESVA